MKLKKKVRKPRDLNFENEMFGGGSASVVPGYRHAEIRMDILYEDQARRLAGWLLKFASWAEQKERK